MAVQRRWTLAGDDSLNAVQEQLLYPSLRGVSYSNPVTFGTS